jgi:hypothetical protein
MRDADKLVMERMKAGCCPICGEKLGEDIKLVQDHKFGIVTVCSKHQCKGVKDVL